MVRLESDERQFIKNFASVNNTTEAEVMRRALKFYISEHYKKFEEKVIKY